MATSTSTVTANEHIISFSMDVLVIIQTKLNMETESDEEYQYFREKGWHYYLRKKVHDEEGKMEIRVRRSNYIVHRDKPFGSRIEESAWIYKEDMEESREKEAKEPKEIIFAFNGYSIQSYVRHVF